MSSAITAVKLDHNMLILPCRPGSLSCGSDKPSKSLVIRVHLVTSNNPRTAKYRYTVTGGRILGAGRDVKWDLSNASPGSYNVQAREVRNGRDLPGIQTATVVVASAQCICDCLNCPQIKIQTTKRSVSPGETFSVSASISGGSQDNPLTLNWTLSAGKIISGQSTAAILIKLTSDTKKTKVIVTLTLGGFDPVCSSVCPRSASLTIDLKTAL
jgi:hypothetical protein